MGETLRKPSDQNFCDINTGTESDAGVRVELRINGVNVPGIVLRHRAGGGNYNQVTLSASLTRLLKKDDRIEVWVVTNGKKFRAVAAGSSIVMKRVRQFG